MLYVPVYYTYYHRHWSPSEMSLPVSARTLYPYCFAVSSAPPKAYRAPQRPAYLELTHHSAAFLAVGATVRQRQVERALLVQEQHPLLIETVRHIGHMQIRNRGTVVGSIAHADPSAELPALLTCLNGEVVVQSVSGERVLKAEEFFTGYLSTSLEPSEMVVEVHFPWLPPQAGWAFMEFARRSGDYALVGAAAILTPALDDQRFASLLSEEGNPCP